MRSAVATSPGKVINLEITWQHSRWHHTEVHATPADTLHNISSPLDTQKSIITNSQSHFPQARHPTPHIAQHHTFHSHTLDHQHFSLLPHPKCTGLRWSADRARLASPFGLICCLSGYLIFRVCVCVHARM